MPGENGRSTSKESMMPSGPFACLCFRRDILQSEVVYKTETENDQKPIRFQITPGVRYAKVPIVFAGASEISAAELSNALDQANLRPDVYANPQKVVDYLNQFIANADILQASVNSPSPQLDPQTGTGSISIQIREGPLFTIGDLEFSGHRAFNYDELWSAIPTSSGSSYDPNTLQDAIKALENLYHGKGYNDVSVTFRVVLDSTAARANLTFYIVERRQSVIRDIAIEGNQDTSPDFVRAAAGFRNRRCARFREDRRNTQAALQQRRLFIGRLPNGGDACH